VNIDQSDEILKYVLKWLKDKNITPSKIALQKILFFLKERGIPLRYEFEAYAYGPFSKEVMFAADYLATQKGICVGRTDYELLPNFTCSLPENLQHELDQHLSIFSDLIDSEFRFDRLELVGTILYCIRSLQEHGMSVSQPEVTKEFKAWKGNKFKQAEIENAYIKLINLFSGPCSSNG
jgi:uncharacterized protein YwgA